MKWMISAVGCLAVMSSVLCAQDVNFQFAGFRDIESAFASQQQVIEDLGVRLAALEGADAIPAPEAMVPGGTTAAMCCDGCCSAGEWYAGAELVIAQPYFEDEIDINQLEDEEVGYDYEATPRLWLGYRSCDGFGVRISYWVFDHSTDAPAGYSEAPFNLEVQALDADVTQSVCWSPVQADLFGGLRYGKVDHRDNDGQGIRFEGVGPTIGTRLALPLCCTNLSMIGGFRGSVLFGETTYAQFNDPPGDDDFIYTFDTHLGLEYLYCTCYGTLAFRAVLESQVWGEAGPDPTNFLDGETSTDESLALLGYTFGVEYRR